MAPKKKGNKKAQDDWESELGETPDPIAVAHQEAKDAEIANDAPTGTVDGEPETAAPAGGLLAALKKNKTKKAKKGKIQEDWLEGEDPPTADGTNGDAAPPVDLSAKAPEEASFEDEDIFGGAGGSKKGKGGKKAAEMPAEVDEAEDKHDADGDGDEDGETGGKVLSKKEKEKEKKEREKQRKKEQVCFSMCILFALLRAMSNVCVSGFEEEGHRSNSSSESRTCETCP